MRIALAITTFLTAAGAAALAVDTKQEQPVPTLKDAYRSDFHIGAAISTELLKGKSPHVLGLVAEQFSSVTPENCMKWKALHPEPGRYDWQMPDRLMSFAVKHDMQVMSHVLVWHNQTPDWVFEDDSGRSVSRDVLLERMREHIQTVMGRYKDRIHDWDVVNEAFEDDGTRRKSRWQEIIGDDYIEHAFRFARQADPEAKLHYNDYSCFKPAKRDAIVKLVKDLKARGVRIDAVGIQGHWSLQHPETEAIEAAINAFAQTGANVMISELDINVLPWPANGEKTKTLRPEDNPYPDKLPAEMQQKLADRYADLFRLFVEHADKITRVSFWGTTDGYSWLNNWPAKGRTNHALLFDRQGKPKPAFHAVIDVAGE
jgi:endo-1,4-beta-xylanase